MTLEPLSARLVEVCDDVLGWIDDPARAAVTAVQAQLREPLRVAVVGRVKAGKSTLVNALIGRRIAPTAATECTQVVTWYRFGRPAGAEVVLRDGSRRPLPFADGLPDTLGLPLEETDHIEVRLQERPLQRFTLVDTPGLASLTSERGEATRAAVLGERASRRAAGDVDAVLFVFRDVERQDEIDFLRSFAAATGDLGASAVNSVGVLSHADLFGAGPHGGHDPIDAASERAERLATDRAGELAAVVAVAGLLAETGRTGRLSERAVAALARLADIDDARLRLWERLKPHHAAGVDDRTMRTLLHLLGPYGVRHARALAAGGAHAVYRWLDERAGVARLEQVLEQRFARRADALKADKALASLDRLIYDQALVLTARRRLADTLEHLRMEPLLHRIKELRVVELLRRKPGADPQLLDTLDRLLSGGELTELLEIDAEADPQTLRAAAVEKAAWGQAVAARAGPHLELAEAGRVVSRSFLLLAERIGS